MPKSNNEPIQEQTSWTRRALLGGGILIAGAAAAGTWRAAATGMLLQDRAAFEPWKTWKDTHVGDPLALVAAAVLASNPHNTQPWLFNIEPGHINVMADPSRNLGAFDPFAREKWMGLGAAIANIEVAGPARGFDLQTQLLPDPSNRNFAARISYRKREPLNSKLALAIDQRRTNRAAYEPSRPIPGQVLKEISKLDNDQVRVLWMPADSLNGQLFRKYTLDGTREISADSQMVEDGHKWFRASPKQVAEHRDGVATPTSGIHPLLATLSPLMPPVSGDEAGKYWLRSTENQLQSAPMFGLLLVRDIYNRKSQLQAGARWQQIHLMLTVEGIAAQPMNQLLEIVDRDLQLGRTSPTAERLANMVGEVSWQPVLAFRTGFASRDVPNSARRPIADVIVT
jgi:hypothetical protein